MRRAAFAALLLLLTAGFVALGVWQVERRAWKLDLIATVEARVHAPAVPAPGPDGWEAVSAADDAYRHVSVDGTWVRGRDTVVQALTVLGAGSWVLTPLRTTGGWTVLVNRGFVGTSHPDPAALAPDGLVHVEGLLRVSEPRGFFLRPNDPARDRWFARDVDAIAARRALDGPVAPFFIDAGAGPERAGAPVGGLTVVSFPNSHLVYALTWFALAGLGVVGIVLTLRRPSRLDAGGRT